VVPAFERLQSWAAEEGLGADDSGALLAEPRSRALLKDEILGEMRDLARFETPKKIGLLAEPFTVENGALTPTQKVKRSVVTEQYGELIESFYRPESVEQTMFTP